uniref:RNA-directed DNA polymerase n=1 Tax=Lygus hesperus TaxID=30085 RepID=A0A0A9YSH7_LYGHE
MGISCNYTTKHRDAILRELHDSHMRISKMKALARSYFWWPKIDHSIEQLGKNCHICLGNRPETPKTVVSQWPEAKYPFQRVHIDLAGPIFGNKNFLILIDAYSKWPEVLELRKTDTFNIVECLREVLAIFGIPSTLVSDNAPNLTSETFENFCTNNGISHLTSPTFHAAKNVVKTFKYSLTKMIQDSTNDLCIPDCKNFCICIAIRLILQLTETQLNLCSTEN